MACVGRCDAEEEEQQRQQLCERKRRAEQELADAEQRFEQVQDALADGAVGTDAKQRRRHEDLLWEKMEEYADRVCQCRDELEVAKGLWQSAGLDKGSSNEGELDQECESSSSSSNEDEVSRVPGSVSENDALVKRRLERMEEPKKKKKEKEKNRV